MAGYYNIMIVDKEGCVTDDCPSCTNVFEKFLNDFNKAKKHGYEIYETERDDYDGSYWVYIQKP